MNPLAVTAFTATTCAGVGVEEFADALFHGRGGLAPNDWTGPETGTALPTWIGRVHAIDAVTLAGRWADRDCRQHRLAWLALAADGFAERAREAAARYAPHRLGVVVGTTTSTIAESERAYREHAATGAVPAALARSDLHHLHATTAFVRDVVGAGGPVATTSTACSSSAKAFAQASRMIATGVVDAVVVGGVDSLAASTLFGFAALGLVSARPCRPFDVARDGISIGEAAGFALVERFDERRHAHVPLLVGTGESSDAHHMSAPHPEGLGARRATVAALAAARLPATAVDYVNLHGTATRPNDAVEAAVVATSFDATTRASSTKGWTGHALGAAGIVEAVACLVAMARGFAPGTLGCDALDPACGPQIRRERTDGPVAIALSNAFAFGGNNCVLAFARDVAAHRERASAR